jgi:hypothetical protein
MPTEEQTYRKGVQDKLDMILEQVQFTNGKVRKITIALVLLAGVVLGLTATSSHELVSLLGHIL